MGIYTQIFTVKINRIFHLCEVLELLVLKPMSGLAWPDVGVCLSICVFVTSNVFICFSNSGKYEMCPRDWKISKKIKQLSVRWKKRKRSWLEKGSTSRRLNDQIQCLLVKLLITISVRIYLISNKSGE